MNAHERRILHSTGKDDWETPAPLFRALDEVYRFTLDAAASRANRKCDLWLSEQEDALRCQWSGRVWLNPPYSRRVGDWVEHAFDQVRLGTAELVACLLYARTDTAWWHDFVMAEAAEVIFFRGRIRFVGAEAPAPAPSALVVFRAGHRGPIFRSMRVPR